MAVQFDPIAKDESLNTTEQTTRNIADVLAQELSGIANAITGGDDKAPKTDIATVEPSNTASRAYSVGELVYVNGNLYKVITAIASGATFTVGTNIQSTNVSSICEELRGGYVVTGTLASSAAFASVPYPDGLNKDNCVIASWMIEATSEGWRTGEGIISATFHRTFTFLSSSVQIFNDDPVLYGKRFKIMLFKI